MEDSTPAIRSLLPRTWHAFLGRFPRPTPVQTEGIPPILKGRPVLLIAPTASGKTEAYASPIAEKILAEAGSRPLSGWIVSPTRALVNDLFRRLVPPLTAVGLRVGRRTGEHREIAGPQKPHLTITTPESLDSILARTPGLTREASFLVLDEVHMVAGSPRGDQLACLVSRLKAIVPHLQVIASSATVEDPAGLAGRYLGPSCQIIHIPGDRPIETAWTRDSPVALADTLQRMTAQGETVRKVLVFVQSRAEAERLFSLFKGRPPFGDAVFLHHGSLSRSRRETVERRMLTGASGLCFATTTLEVGIDIGDMDLIVLASPPPDVSSLLQRIGRGSRRSGVTRVCCMSRDEAQTLRYEHLMDAARKGRLLGGPYHFCPSVLAQQCLSLLMQSPGQWITASALASRMPTWLRQTGWTTRLPELLEHLAQQDWLEKKGEKYIMGERLEAAFPLGRIHGNIENGSSGVEVVDQETRRVLGTLPPVATGGDRLLFGGRRLKIARTVSRSRVLVTDTRANALLKVASNRGPLVHSALARDLARFIGLAPHAAPILRLEDGEFAIFHFLGDLWGTLLWALLDKFAGMRPQAANAFSLVLPVLPAEWPLNLPAEKIRSAAIRHRIRLRRVLVEGPWAKEIPRDWRNQHLLECLDIGPFRKALQDLVIQELPPSPLDQVLLLLTPARFASQPDASPWDSDVETPPQNGEE